MKHVVLLSGVVVLIILLSGNVIGQSEVTISNPNAVIYENCVNYLNVKFTHTPGDGSAIIWFTNGFRVWTSNNGLTNRPDTVVFDTIPLCWSKYLDGGVFLASFGNDGFGEDTLGFGGFRLFEPGLEDPFDQTVFTIGVPIGAQAGDTLCIDSSWYRPANPWLWGLDGQQGSIQPTWAGPYCWPVTSSQDSNACNVGACYDDVNDCYITTEAVCDVAGDSYQGDGSTCGITCSNFPSGPAHDFAPSLGVFRIYIRPEFRVLVESIGLNPCGDSINEFGCYGGLDTFHLTSPVLYDPGTVIARSDPHLDGSDPDTLGTTVGDNIYATTVSDGDMTVLPSFEGPDGITEVHTAIADMAMTDRYGLGVQVRAGHTLGLPLSPGEVESKAGLNLPGESFFNVFVEVTFPSPVGDIVLTNPVALLIVNDSVTTLPPKVVYTHNNSTAVPVRFSTNNPPHWNTDDLFGYLVLAGHGYQFNFAKDSRSDLDEFLTFMNEEVAQGGQMPLCCEGIRGNVDGIAGVDVADLTYLVDYLFGGGPAPTCFEEGDIDGGESIDVADLTYLVDYLFGGGPAPVACS